MTQKQIENAIKNLQLSVATLASKTYNRDSRAETSIYNVDAKANEVSSGLAEMELAEADILIDICCLQLGIDKSDLMAEESEDET